MRDGGRRETIEARSPQTSMSVPAGRLYVVHVLEAALPILAQATQITFSRSAGTVAAMAVGGFGCVLRTAVNVSATVVPEKGRARHVGGRAGNRPRQRDTMVDKDRGRRILRHHPGLTQLRQAEVEHLDSPAVRYDDVGSSLLRMPRRGMS